MTINIADNTPRVSYTVAQGVTQTSFTVTFEFFAEADLNVYIDGVLKTLTTDYTVTGGDGSTGSITMSVTGASGGSTVVITRQIAFERTTDFPSQGAFQVTTLNTELDRLTAVAADLNDEISRSLRLTDYDSSANLTLPDLASRAGKVLAFDAVTGDLVNGPSTAGVTTVAAAAADIATLADIEDGTVATDAISNTATVVSDIPTVAGIASDVSTVAGISSDVTTVANNVSDVTAFAQIYRVGSTDPTSNNDVGDLFYNTTLDTLKIWTGAAWVTAASEISGYLPVTGGTITGDLTLSGGSGNDILFDQSEKLLLFKNGAKAAFGSIPSSNANPNTADIEIYRNNLEGAVIGFADTSTASGTKNPNYIKDLTADVNYIQFTPTQDVALFYNGVEKFATENTGVGVIGDVNVSGLVDGRDVAADGTKLDGIEASADVTDAGNVNPLVDAHLNQSTAASGELLSWNGSDYDWIAAGGSGDLLAANNLSDLDNAATARTNLGVAIGSDVQAHSSVLDGTTASFTTAKDSKLTGIEAGADVTDTTNVTAAGALMDSEVTNLAQVKAFDSSDYATAAQGTTADAALPRTGGAMTGAITTNSTFDGRDVATDGAKLDGIASGANNYVHPNHTGEVTSTADGATVIADNVVDEANLKVSNAPTNGYALTAQSGAAGGLTWAAVSGGSYNDSDVDTHLNTSTAATNEVLSWTGTDYDWVAQSGGGGADLYAANESSPAAQPSATGTNAIAIGDSAVASGNNAVALGASRAAGTHSFAAAIGSGSSSYGATTSYSIAIGYQAKVTNWGGAAFGFGAVAAGSNYNVALGNSYVSGGNAISAAIASNSSSYGATGGQSIAIGYQAKASSTNSVAIGDRAIASGATSFALLRGTASGSNSIAMGLLSDATAQGSIALGNGYSFNGAQATFYNAIAIGQGSLSDKIGKVAVSGSAFSASGDSQHGIFVLRVATTNNTATALITGNDYSGSATPDDENQIILPDNSAFSFHGTIVARESAASGTDCAAWKVEGLIRREGSAGTTVLVNSATTVLDNTPSWGMALSADTTNGGLAITVTGAAATNVRWVGTIHTSEVTYA